MILTCCVELRDVAESIATIIQRGNQMTFTEYVRMMKKYIYLEETSDRRFLNRLFMGMMRAPQTHEELEKDAEGDYYPFSKEGDRYQTSRIFNATGDVSEKDAKKALDKADTDRLYEAIVSLPDSRRQELKNELRGFGIDCADTDLEDACINLLTEIFEAKIKRKGVKRQSSAAGIPLPTAYILNGQLFVGENSITLPPALQVEEEVLEEEQPYVKALLEAYADATVEQVFAQCDLEKLPKKYQVNFRNQRKAFFAAESARRQMREVYPDSEHQFKLLEQDAFDGIEEVYWEDYDNGYKRLEAVLIKITNTSLDKSTLMHIKNLIGNLEKKGLCHILVNEKYIASWVHLDE